MNKAMKVLDRFTQEVYGIDTPDRSMWTMLDDIAVLINETNANDFKSYLENHNIAYYYSENSYAGVYIFKII